MPTEILNIIAEWQKIGDFDVPSLNLCQIALGLNPMNCRVPQTAEELRRTISFLELLPDMYAVRCVEAASQFSEAWAFLLKNLSMLGNLYEISPEEAEEALHLLRQAHPQMRTPV